VFPENVEYGDIVKGLPIAPASCDGVYCSHVLEHLALSGCRRALRNTHSYLLPGGTFRLVLPDLRHLAKTYLDSHDAGAAIAFLRNSRLGAEDRPGGVRGMVHAWLSNTMHRWMWDYVSMESELRAAGFRDIRPATIGDSEDPRFGALESPDRWENALGVECRR
jgi:predicted SAM-dependent methyltransferase